MIMTTSFDSSSTPIPGTDSRPSQLPPQAAQPPLEPSTIQPFPPPQTFTFLPQLYTLISRLTPLQTAHASATRASRSPTLTRDGPRSKSSASATDALPTDATSVAMTRTASALSGLTHTRSREESIEIKDLPALMYPLRQQIERAKETVRTLPDVGRGVAEQEEEIRVLEERIGGLKGRLARLRGLAAGSGEGGPEAVEDVVMQGTEG